MQMYENATTATREPCKHCGQNHDEMQCALPQHDETELFDAVYDYSTHHLEKHGHTPTTREAIEKVLGREVSDTEHESLEEIAQNAIRDAERDKQ